MNTIDDKKDYGVVNKAMKMIGFTDRERETVWKLVAAIIHLVCIEMLKLLEHFNTLCNSYSLCFDITGSLSTFKLRGVHLATMSAPSVNYVGLHQ